MENVLIILCVSFTASVLFGAIMRLSWVIYVLMALFAFGWAIGNSGGVVPYFRSLWDWIFLVTSVGFFCGLPFGYSATSHWLEKPNE